MRAKTDLLGFAVRRSVLRSLNAQGIWHICMVWMLRLNISKSYKEEGLTSIVSLLVCSYVGRGDGQVEQL